MLLNGNRLAKIALALAMPSSLILLYWLYKRSSPDEIFVDEKVLTTRNIVIEVPVPPQAVGPIIGKQGTVIKKLQKDSGAKLFFKEKVQNDSNNANCMSFRTLCIQGSPECAQKAEMMVQQILTSISEAITEQIEVPSFAIGMIIGKGGTSIREISHKSGAKVLIDRSEGSKANNEYRTIEVTGSREQIDKAVEIIEEKLNDLLEKRSKTEESAKKNGSVAHRELKRGPLISDVQEETMWDEPKQTLIARTPNENVISIYVSAVEHPGHFWVQVIGAKALHLEEIHKDITTFVGTDEARENYVVMDVNIGELVAAKFCEDDSTYYRAKILGETPDGLVDLYFIDFGDNTLAKREDIFKLRQDFVNYPAQAIECGLANVQPAGGAWSEEAIITFENLTHCALWKVLSCEMLGYKHNKEGNMVPLVRLVDADNEVDIAKELIKQDLAIELESIVSQEASAIKA